MGWGIRRESFFLRGGGPRRSKSKKNQRKISKSGKKSKNNFSTGSGLKSIGNSKKSL